MRKRVRVDRTTLQMETTESGTVVRTHRAEVDVYQITGERLDTLTSVDHATWLTAASACLSISVTLIATFISGYSTGSALMNYVVFGSAMVTLGPGVVCGIIAWRSLRRHHKAVRDFKAGSQNKV